MTHSVDYIESAQTLLKSAMTDIEALADTHGEPDKADAYRVACLHRVHADCLASAYRALKSVADELAEAFKEAESDMLKRQQFVRMCQNSGKEHCFCGEHSAAAFCGDPRQ